MGSDNLLEARLSPPQALPQSCDHPEEPHCLTPEKQLHGPAAVQIACPLTLPTTSLAPRFGLVLALTFPEKPSHPDSLAWIRFQASHCQALPRLETQARSSEFYQIRLWSQQTYSCFPNFCILPMPILIMCCLWTGSSQLPTQMAVRIGTQHLKQQMIPKDGFGEPSLECSWRFLLI